MLLLDRGKASDTRFATDLGDYSTLFALNEDRANKVCVHYPDLDPRNTTSHYSIQTSRDFFCVFMRLVLDAGGQVFGHDVTVQGLPASLYGDLRVSFSSSTITGTEFSDL